MLRVVSWMRRFIGSCRRQYYAFTFLCPSELDQSLKLIVRCLQQCSLSYLYMTLKAGRNPTRSFASLSPYIDAEGLIRVGGRLRHAALPTDIAPLQVISLLNTNRAALAFCHFSFRTQNYHVSYYTNILDTFGPCRYTTSYRLMYHVCAQSCPPFVSYDGQPSLRSSTTQPAVFSCRSGLRGPFTTTRVQFKKIETV